MSNFYFPCKKKRIVRALEKLGLRIVIKKGKHDKVICPITGEKTDIPRHNDIKSGVVKSICDFLLEQGYKEEKIKEALKIK